MCLRYNKSWDQAITLHQHNEHFSKQMEKKAVIRKISISMLSIVP